MMLEYFDKHGLVKYVQNQPETWQEALQLSCQSLIEQGLITEEYVDEIIQNVKDNGPYIVIADQVAMPHAMSNSPGVTGTGISFTKFPKPVIFHDEATGEDKPATLFFTLAAKNAEEHLENITHLMDLLMDEETVAALLETKTIEDFKKLI